MSQQTPVVPTATATADVTAEMPQSTVIGPVKRVEAQLEGGTIQPLPNSAEMRAVQAQEALVDWAGWMFWVAFATVLVTAVGTAFLIKQIGLTRSAVKSAQDSNAALQAANAFSRENANRQLRAYIGTPRGTIKHLSYGQTPQVGIAYQNFGQTPAIMEDIDFYVFIKNQVGGGNIQYKCPTPPQRICEPGHIQTITALLQGAKIDLSRGTVVRAEYTVVYRDLLDNRVWRRIGYYADRAIRSFSRSMKLMIMARETRRRLPFMIIQS